MEDQSIGGERPLFHLQNAEVRRVIFPDGESLLKEGRDLKLDQVLFKYKYPLWNDENVTVTDSLFEEMGRSGIWYTNNITIKDTTLQAPKLFRRSKGIKLTNVHFAHVEETMWTCEDIELTNVQVNGDYFGMNSKHIVADHLDLVGNYAFDGAEDVLVTNSRLMSKDCFWNTKRVTVKDSILSGEYLAWHSENLTLINCVIESDQGLNYVDHLTVKNCRINDSPLLFEYGTNLDVQVIGNLTSVKNPISGTIQAPAIGTIIIDPTKVSTDNLVIKTDNNRDQRILTVDPNPNEQEGEQEDD
ncbi:DUF3737 family protein [Limosilactobacillus fermentum]|uniref:DUF3737 family protein n=1 Tax=Limosilactobacillus fermentum TaxID=1613 RepID=UPI002181F988|nr:DUF3737 family protein [Limosilactobacillus fermentum]MCH5398293.1 DUF3737 family protein [Limosilactobacillus fermentum]MDQ7201829.1 DUF3737 family protein [Limosilactobacillus fermentum]